MRFNQIVETTTAGSVATVAQPMMTQTRENVNVPGLKPVQQLMKGKSNKKGPYANSINEGKVKQLTIDLKELTDEEFKKKYGKTKVEIRSDMKKVNEDDLAEQDLIVIPGQGRLRRTGFVKQDLDQGEHEGHTLKNSLHTIARAASDLDKRLSVQSEFPEWVSEKIGAAKGMMVTVMDYLISSQEMQHDTDTMAEGSDPTRKVFFKVIKTQGTGMPSGYRRVKTMRPLEDGGFYIELSTPGYGMDYTRHNYKNFSLKGKPITGYEANRIINGEQGVAEGKWDPFTGGDYGQTPRPQRVGQDSEDNDIAAPNKEKDQAEWEAMLDYYGTNALVQRALGDLYKQTHGRGYHDSVVTPDRYLATIEKTFAGKTTTEKKYFPNKQAAHKYAKSSFGHVISFEKIDDKEDTTDLITLPVMLGLGQQKKKWMLQFPDEGYAQKWAFKHKNVATIMWPAGHNLEKGVAEGRGFSGIGGARDREDDEHHHLDPSDWFVFKDGKMYKVSVYPNQHDSARSHGYSPSREEAKAKAARGSQDVAEGSNEKEYIVIASMGENDYELEFRAKTPDGALMQAKKWQKQNHIREVHFTVKEQGVAEGKIDFAKKLQKNVDKHNKAVVKTKQDIGSRVADIGAGGKEYNVKTDAAWDAAKKKVAEGSVPKEKQKTPYRDINSPEYKAAADKQKEKMTKDKEAEPGKKLADKIDNKKK
jgi:hypothetical protein